MMCGFWGAVRPREILARILKCGLPALRQALSGVFAPNAACSAGLPADIGWIPAAGVGVQGP